MSTSSSLKNTWPTNDGRKWLTRYSSRSAREKSIAAGTGTGPNTYFSCTTRSAMVASHRSRSARRDGNRGRASGVLVAQPLRIEDIAGRLAERLQREAQQVLRDAAVAVAHLPQVPESIDHAVMGEEDRIERRRRDVGHVGADPHVHL